MKNLNIVVAYDENRAIGKNDSLLWEINEMRADMHHFRLLTLGETIIMGRKTLDSIGMALPGRRNIVLSRSDKIEIPSVEVAHSLDDAYAMSNNDNAVFVIGGEQVYNQAINSAERIYATEVDAAIEGADAYFPRLGPEWKTAESQEFSPDESNIYPYRFVTYDRY